MFTKAAESVVQLCAHRKSSQANVLRGAKARIVRMLVTPLLIGMAAFAAHAQAPVSLIVTGNISGTGTMTLWVDTYSKAVRYGPFSTAASLASAFGGTISLDVNAPVWAKGYPNGDIKMSMRQGGSVSNVHIDVTPDAGFPTPPIGVGTNVGAVQNGNPSSGTAVYSYSITTATGASGYDASGNIHAFTDSVNGQWTAGYDSVNRIVSAFQSSTTKQFETAWGNAMQQYLCWQYDSFGNRMQQASSSSPFTNGANCTPSGSAVTAAETLSVTADNRISNLYYNYDQSGNLTEDAIYIYKYDGAGRMCAAQKKVTGETVAYLYDAEGRRVAKGAVASGTTQSNWCNFAANGFVMTSRYVTGPSGSTLTEFNSAGTSRSDVPLVSGVGATFTSDASAPAQTHFQFSDLVGTRRVQTDSLGTSEQTCEGAVFGDFLKCTGLEATPNHFTGKERDSETASAPGRSDGLDYFGARYYGASVGRWTSPDSINITDERLLKPTNTLNKYTYAANNPLRFTDPDGQDITIFYEQGNPIPGHIMMLAYNQQTGDSDIRSFGPDHARSSIGETAANVPVAGTDRFGFEDIHTVDDLRNNYSILTIRTTPEEAQQVINAMRLHPDDRYTTYWNNCTTTCSKLLRAIHKTQSHALQPRTFFNELYAEQRGIAMGRAEHLFVPGKQYGASGLKYDPFALFFDDITSPNPNNNGSGGGASPTATRPIWDWLKNFFHF